MDKWAKGILRFLGLGGFLLSGFLFSMTFVSPITFEIAGKSIILPQVENRVRETLGDFESRWIEKMNRHLSSRNEEDISAIKRMLQGQIPERVSAVVSEMQDLDCECRLLLASKIRKALQIRMASLEDAEMRIKAMMQLKYVEVATRLLLDLRIFSGSNTFVFFLLLFASLMKPAAIAQIFLPGIVLFVAMLVSSYFYLFEQNWFFTILYNDYLGWAYIAYLASAFLFLCDIVFNKARVTTEILNQLLGVLGRASVLTPC